MCSRFDDRQGRGSTIITSQVDVKHWHDMIANPTVAARHPRPNSCTTLIASVSPAKAYVKPPPSAPHLTPRRRPDRIPMSTGGTVRHRRTAVRLPSDYCPASVGLLSSNQSEMLLSAFVEMHSVVACNDIGVGTPLNSTGNWRHCTASIAYGR